MIVQRSTATPSTVSASGVKLHVRYFEKFVPSTASGVKLADHAFHESRAALPACSRAAISMPNSAPGSRPSATSVCPSYSPAAISMPNSAPGSRPSATSVCPSYSPAFSRWNAAIAASSAAGSRPISAPHPSAIIRRASTTLCGGSTIGGIAMANIIAVPDGAVLAKAGSSRTSPYPGPCGCRAWGTARRPSPGPRARR